MIRRHRRQDTRRQYQVSLVTFEGVPVTDTIQAYNPEDAKAKVRNAMRANHGATYVTITDVTEVAR